VRGWDVVVPPLFLCPRAPEFPRRILIGSSLIKPACPRLRHRHRHNHRLSPSLLLTPLLMCEPLTLDPPLPHQPLAAGRTAQQV